MIRRVTIAAATLFAAAPLYAVTYTFEPQHTQGVIRWNHLGFANPTAQFNTVEGTLEFDPADPTHSSVAVTIPLTSMSTGVPDLNDDFRSSDFFDFAKFPTATFKSRKVEKGGTPDRARPPITKQMNVKGIARRSPDMRSSDWLPPIAPITEPAAMNNSALKNACVIRWNRPAA